MSDCVPDFHAMEGDYGIPTSSGFSRPRKSAPGEEDVMELMWHNGQVLVQQSSKKSSFSGGEAVDEPVVREIRPGNEEQQHLFMQEDEMSSWLQYPLDDSSFDRNFYGDMLFSAPPPQPPVASVAPPIPLRPEISPRSHNFAHFSRIPIRPRTEQVSSSSIAVAGQSKVVESNVTPAVRPESRVSHTAASNLAPVNTESGTSTAAGEFSRKRKDKEAGDSESQSEDIEFEAAEAKKHAPSSSSMKRSRAAEVHNLSERRRRDKINEKMKALQELIPRCNKSDKASMLDEAIEYLKSLQLQVQMMSMGYGMMPMMYPGMQQYMPAMGMGMGMNRSILPYPSMVQGPGIPNLAAATHMGPRFPMPAAFHLPPVRLPDPSRIHAPNQSDSTLSSLVALNSNLPQMPNFVDPYQQFLGLQQAQLSLQRNQLTGRTNADNHNPSTRKETGNRGHQQTG